MSAQGGKLFAKAVLLGDDGTGRASLMENLRAQASNADEAAKMGEDFFLPVELAAHEVESSQPVTLKLWKYADNLSRKDEQLAFRGALFAVVTFNICSSETFRSVFDRWIPLKEQLSPDSFLIVVGTHFDCAHTRQVSLADSCKACAKKDALYMELSNVTLQNVPLFRRLICKRVNYILQRRDELATLGGTYATHPLASHAAAAQGEERSSEETKQSRHASYRSSIAVPHSDLSIPYLEPNIMTESVGSILASCYGLDTWRRFEYHEAELQKTGQQIESFLHDLAQAADGLENNTELNNLVASYSEDLLRAQERRGHNVDYKDGNPMEGEEDDLGDLKAHYKEINEAFKILGLNAPKSLLHSIPNEPPANLPTTLPEDYWSAPPNRPNLRKMMVRLPTGVIADMVLDLEANMDQQIELFLLSHSLAHDDEARKKLIATTTKVQRDYMDTLSRPRSASSRSSTNASQAPAGGVLASTVNSFGGR